MSDIAKLGFSVDTQGLKKGEKALNDFAKTGEQTEKRTDKSSKKIIDDFEGIEKAVGRTAAEQLKADKAMAQFSRRSGQAGIQFQQFIGQVQGGQGVMLALSQQSADLGFVLGAPLLGAIAGISASLIGLLIPNLIDTTSAMEDLDKAMETVNKTATDTDGIKAFTKEIAAIAEESEKAGRLMILAAEQSARDAGRAAAEGIGEEFNDAFDVTIFQTSFDALKSIAGTAGGTGFTISAEYRELGEQFGLTGVAAREAGIDVLVSLREMEIAVGAGLPDAGDKIVAFQEKLAELAETSSGENKTKLLTFVNSISEYVDKAKLAAEMSELFNDTLKETDLDLVTEESIKLNSAVEGVANSLEAQIIALRDGEDAAIRWSIAQRLGLESVEEIPEAIQAQIEQIKALKLEREEDLELMKEIREEEKLLAAQQKKDKADAEKQMKKRERDFEKLTKQIKGFGGAWSKTGSIIVDTFGDIADAMTDYMDRMDEIEANEKSLAEFREEKGEDNAEVIALQQKLEEDRVSAELSGMKSIAKAGEALFAEKTAAAKAFAALNKIITVAEIALSYQKIAAGTAETTAHVANETTKTGANALTAITSAFAAPFPVNFVAGAAMIGIMAGLLGGFSGGGSSIDMTEQRQETQGTGTVLGSDDKSQSILESQERFEEIQIDQLAELRGIRDSLNSVASGIALVTRNLIASRGLGDFGGDLSEKQSGSGIVKLADSLGLSSILGIFGDNFVGDVLGGLFGKTKKKITDSGIAFVSQSLAEIMESGVVQASQFFDIEKTKKKLFGLSKKVSTSTEFQALDSSFGEGIGAVFKNIGDVVLQSAELLGFETVSILQSTLMGPLTEEDFAEFGRGIAGRFAQTFEMTEVSLEEALSRFQVDIGQISLEGLSGEEVEQELQAIFSQQADLIAEFLVPSIAEYQKIGEGLFDTLTRVAQEQVIFNDNIERMGIDLSALSNVMQIDVAQAVIGLTGGLENFSDLSNSFIDEFFTDAEKFEMLETSISEVFDSLGLSMVDSKEDFRALVEGIDLTTESGQELFAVLLEISPAFAEYIDQLEDQVGGMENLTEAAETAFSMLEQAIQLDKQRAAANLDIAREAHNAELSRIEGLRTVLEAENQLRNDNLLTAEDMLNKSFSSEMNRIREGSTAEINAVKERTQSSVQAIKDSTSVESKLIKDAATARIASLNNEKTAIKATASAMRSLVKDINSSLGLSGSSSLISALASARSGDFSGAQSLDIGSLSNLDSGNFSSAEDLAVQQALNQNRLQEIGNLAGSKLTDAEARLVGIDRQIEATKSSSALQIEALQQSSENQINNINDNSENEILAIQEDADRQLEELQEQLNALLGIDTSVLSLDEAIKQFQEAQQAVVELGYQAEVERLDMLVDSANDVYALHEQAYADEIERLDQILTDNEALLNAALGIDTSVLSVADAIAALNASIDALNSPSGSEETNPVTNPFSKGDDQYIPVVPVKPVLTSEHTKPNFQQEEIKEELRQTREDNVMFQRELVKNTKQTARLLQRFELNGLDTRQIQ